jgi:hypothetical protein
MNAAVKEKQVSCCELGLNEVYQKIHPIVRIDSNTCFLKDINLANIKEGNFIDFTSWRPLFLEVVNLDTFLVLQKIEICQIWEKLLEPCVKLENIYQYILFNFSKEMIKKIIAFEIVEHDVNFQKTFKKEELSKEHSIMVKIYIDPKLF